MVTRGQVLAGGGGGVEPEGGRPKVEGEGAGAGVEPPEAGAGALPLGAGVAAGDAPPVAEGAAGAGGAPPPPPGLGERTERMRAQVEVVAAELVIWLCCWAEMALCMPMPRVSVITALSIAMVWLGAPWTVKCWASWTESTIWLLVMGGGSGG